MAQRTTFDKLQRDRAKKAKQALKRERRQEKGNETDAEDVELPAGEGPLTAQELMAQVEAITRRLDAGTITLEDFEDAKAELMLRLPIE